MACVVVIMSIYFNWLYNKIIISLCYLWIDIFGDLFYSFTAIMLGLENKGIRIGSIQFLN